MNMYVGKRPFNYYDSFSPNLVLRLTAPVYQTAIFHFMMGQFFYYIATGIYVKCVLTHVNYIGDIKVTQ